MKKKKRGAIIVIFIILVAVVGGLYYAEQEGFFSGSSKDKVYVEQVSSLNSENLGAQNRYSGKVEPQQTWEVKKEAEKVIKEIFVAEGDEVVEGDALFEYDTADLTIRVQQGELELEEIDNEISNYQNQIRTLESERSSASSDDKFQYTTQIQTLETSIKQAEYNKESKQVEIENLLESIDNAIVLSEIAGVIMSIDENEVDPMTGEATPFLTVLATGDYRVMGTISEQNIYTLNAGQPVIVRSRVNENQTYKGSITEIDTENQVTNNQNVYYDSNTAAETATKYPFYISLESHEGLILGQHVYIELDFGQTDERGGIWIPESYLVFDEEPTENETSETAPTGDETSETVPTGDETSETAPAEDELSETVPAEDETSETVPGDMDLTGADLLPGANEPGQGDIVEGEQPVVPKIMPEEAPSGAANEPESLLKDGEKADPEAKIPAFVWADEGQGKLEKRYVNLGEYDMELGMYEIKSGLTEEDYNAFPMAALYEGVSTVKDKAEVDQEAPMYQEEGNTNPQDNTAAPEAMPPEDSVEASDNAAMPGDSSQEAPSTEGDSPEGVPQELFPTPEDSEGSDGIENDGVESDGIESDDVVESGDLEIGDMEVGP